MTEVAEGADPALPDRQAQFRYGVVFLLVLAMLVFEVLAPDADWARAVGVALAAAALTVVVGTSRARSPVRRQRALWVGVIALLVVIAIATGLLSVGITYILSVMLAISIPVALMGGLLRLVRASGVTLQAVAGALAIYLLVGLLFA